MNAHERRWKIALAAVMIHLSIGSIYGWSQVAVTLKEQLNSLWSIQEITYTFSLAIMCLGLSAATFGHFVERYGPRISGLLATFLFTSGLFLGGIAIQERSLFLLYIGYGILVGTGTGLGYITPVSTLLKWFPDRRGLSMGIAIMGFGFGAAFYVWLLESFLPSIGIQQIGKGLMILSGFYFIVMITASCFLKTPPSSWTKKISQDDRVKPLSELYAREAIQTPQFYFLWILLFINITCGIGVISLAKDIGIEMVHMTSKTAAVMVMLMSIFNGIGRIGWAMLSDYITRPLTYSLFFVIQIGAFFMLARVPHAGIFQILVLLIITCYGGGFALIPAYIGDVFGTKEAGAIHGYILTAWSAAGICGPMLVATLLHHTGGYVQAFNVFIGMLIFAFIISLLMMRRVELLKKQQLKDNDCNI